MENHLEDMNKINSRIWTTRELTRIKNTNDIAEILLKLARNINQCHLKI